MLSIRIAAASKALQQRRTCTPTTSSSYLTIRSSLVRSFSSFSLKSKEKGELLDTRKNGLGFLSLGQIVRSSSTDADICVPISSARAFRSTEISDNGSFRFCAQKTRSDGRTGVLSSQARGIGGAIDSSRWSSSLCRAIVKQNVRSGGGNALRQDTVWDRAHYSWHAQQHFSTESSLKTNNEKSTEPKDAVAADPSVSKPWTTTTNTPLPSRTLSKTAVPTPPSSPPAEINPLQRFKGTTPKSVIRKGVDLAVTAFKKITTFLVKLPANVFFYATHPTETREAWIKLRDMAKDEAHHYWVGTKLLWADIVTARKLLNKTLEGSSLTRRERKQMLRTVSDLFRLIPFSMFVLVPFMEFALPLALRLFPNMLPSTYQDSLKAEENMKRELKSRIAMAQFFQETLEELAKEQKRKAATRKKELEDAGVDLEKEGDTTIAAQKDSAGSMLEFLKKARSGEMIPPDVIIRYANYFKDDLTLDNMPRMQLINMCKYMSIQPYGSDSFLRFQLRHKIRVLKEDDQRILWEGIQSLTKMELREACQERGMRSTGLSKDAYRRALQQWLDLSVNKDLPIALLIMSRTFFLREEMFERDGVDDSKSLAGLADAISGMDKEILNEVILEVATKEEKRSDRDVRKIKLEVLSQQNELIREEEEAREAAAKKKAVPEKEKAERPAVEETLSSPQSALEAPAPSTAVHAAASKATSAEADRSASVVADDEDDSQLSTEEMDVISQLTSDDPVCKERQELERIKSAMKGREGGDAAKGAEVVRASGDELSDPAKFASRTDFMSSEEADRMAKVSLDRMDKHAAAIADESTKISLDDHIGVKSSVGSENTPTADESDDVDDPIIARLKKRVESMVDKIEVQLTETHVKIGDKLHFLDKDKDGILSREEMAAALQQVLKRQISFEEAMEIADEMDGNQDGVFTVEELRKWIDESKLVKLVKEGRDAEMDRIMENQSTNHQKVEENSTNEKVETK